MDLAKPGLIKEHCLPNAMLTFAEYLNDFADTDLKEKGTSLINEMLRTDISSNNIKQRTQNSLEDIKNGKRDIYF